MTLKFNLFCVVLYRCCGECYIGAKISIDQSTLCSLSSFDSLIIFLLNRPTYALCVEYVSAAVHVEVRSYHEVCIEQTKVKGFCFEGGAFFWRAHKRLAGCGLRSLCYSCPFLTMHSFSMQYCHS